MNLQLPSSFKSQLEAWKGNRIASMTRLLDDAPESIPRLYHIPEPEIFSFFSAPLLLELSNGKRFAVAADPGQASVLIDETDFRVGDSNSGNIPIGFLDKRFSDGKFAGIDELEICGLSIYVRNPKNGRLALRPREAGIGIHLANGRQIVLSCGLHDGSDDFSVIYHEDIPEHITMELVGTRI